MKWLECFIYVKIQRQTESNIAYQPLKYLNKNDETDDHDDTVNNCIYLQVIYRLKYLSAYYVPGIVLIASHAVT